MTCRRRWSRDLSKRSLERVGVDWTIQALRAEGHNITDVWSPEEEPGRHPERRRRPDGACIVDGIETAIEHTRFLTKRRAREWVRAAEAPGTALERAVRILPISDRTTPAEFDAFLEATIASKADQHAGWARGILAVTHNWDQLPERLREAVVRRRVVPWWRVYWIERQPPAVLVWES